jgi:hypothetical protein
MKHRLAPNSIKFNFSLSELQDQNDQQTDE